MDLSKSMAKAKAIAEGLMVDSCQIYTETKGDFDRDTGTHTVTKTLKYSGPCIFAPSGIPSDGDQFFLLQVPVETENIQRGDFVRCLSASYDQKMADREFEVVDDTVMTYAVMRQAVIVNRRQPGT